MNNSVNLLLTSGTPDFANPVISIDRKSQSCACFDSLNVMRDFQPFTDEKEAISKALEFFSGRVDKLPRILHPEIRVMKVITHRITSRSKRGTALETTHHGNP